jgi:cell fate (sporulation/competence/biofilm development) regulator YlbF (YheA/YmcA/DUF963 family)
VSIRYDSQESRRLFKGNWSLTNQREGTTSTASTIWEKKDAYTLMHLERDVKKQLTASQKIPVMLQPPDLSEMEENLQELAQRLAASQEAQRRTEAKRQVLVQQLRRCKKKLRQFEQIGEPISGWQEGGWSALNKTLGAALVQSGVDQNRLRMMRQDELVEFLQVQLAPQIGKNMYEQMHEAPTRSNGGIAPS